MKLHPRFIAFVAALLLVFAAVQNDTFAAGDAWPMYGHDAAHTARSASNGPNTPDIKWTYQADGGVRDNVVAPDGTIYMTVTTNTTEQVVALNPNGTEKWKVDSAGIRYAYPAVGTDGNIYVIVNKAEPDYLRALDPDDGSTVWDFDIGRSSIGSGLTFLNNSRTLVGPDGTVYVASAYGKAGYGTIFAINPNGTQKWAWDTHNDALYCGTSTYLIYCAIESSPVLAPNGNLIFKPYGEGAIALNSDTGAFIWRSDFGPNAGGADPFAQSLSIGADNVAYTTEGGGRFNFVAVNPDGTVKWVTALENWNDYAVSALSADGTTLYRGDNGGIFYALNTSDGSVRWKLDTGIEGAYLDGAPVLAANGMIYFTIGSTTGTPSYAHGYVYAVRADDRTIVWQYEVGFVAADLAMGADGTLYVSGEGDKLYAFECQDGSCPAPAHNSTQTVTNLNDFGPGSLRQAINSALDGDTIVFQPGLTGTINISDDISYPLNIDTDLTITGPGGNQITLDGGGNTWLFHMLSGTNVTISGLTLANGAYGVYAGGDVLHLDNMIIRDNYFSGLGGSGTITVNQTTFSNNNITNGSGAAISTAGGNVTITNSTFTGNHVTGSSFDGNGGAIHNSSGDMTISDSIFTGNTASNRGGAIYNENGPLNSNQLIINNSTFSNNTGDSGGAIYNFRGNLTVNSSAFTNNQAALVSGTFGGEGGAIHVFSGTVTIANSTIAGNSATTNGGAVYTRLYTGWSDLTLINTTIANNTAANGGGIFNNDTSSVALKNTIIATNTATSNANCQGTITNSSGNLQYPGTGCGASISVGDPKLAALANNGGPTQTMALLDGSAAIDAGDNATCAAAPISNLDQRGTTRPFDAYNDSTPTCDIGAFERTTLTPNFQINNVSVAEGNSGTKILTFTVTRTVSTTGTASVQYATANDTATAGQDYTATSGTLNFANGIATQTIDVTISGDSTYEDDETFFVNLSNPTPISIGESQGIGTIQNDDPAPPVPPNAPSNLAAVGVSTSQINLSWTDNSTTETSFRIERSPNGTSGWAEIASVATNQTTYQNTGLAASTTYYYRVRAHRSDLDLYSTYSNSDDGTTQLGNDDFDNAIVISSLPYNGAPNTATATTDIDDPLLSCRSNQQGYHSAWYRYTPAANHTLLINTFGSSYDTVLAVWTGTRGTLQNQACDDDTSGTQSAVSLAVSAGTTYYIEVVGYSSGDSGALNLSVSTPPAPEIVVEAPGSVNIADGSTYNMGTTTVGTPLSKTITVRNTGAVNLTISTNPPTVTGNFTAGNFGSTTLAPSASTTFNLTCTASAVGAPASGTISFSNTDGDENPFNFTVQCTVNNAPEIIVEAPGSINIADGSTYNMGVTDFGLPINQTITVRNAGTVNLTISTNPPTVTGNFAADNFGSTTLAQNASTTFTLTCRAAATGAPVTGTVSFGNNDSNENPFNFTVQCTVAESSSSAAPQPNRFTTHTPTLTWNSLTGVTTYDVQIANNLAFTGATTYSAISGTTFTTPTLSNGVYYWRVRPVGTNSWSAGEHFVIAAVP